MTAKKSTTSFKYYQSQGAYHQFIEKNIQLLAPMKKVWSIITEPSHLELFHPFCAANPVIKWPGAESHDRLEYLNGRVLERHFSDWKEGHGYALWIGRDQGRQSYVIWSLTSEPDEHTCQLTIRIYPHFFNMSQLWHQKLAFHVWIRSKISLYLESVLGGLAWYINQRRPIPANYFGQHPWFS